MKTTEITLPISCDPYRRGVLVHIGTLAGMQKFIEENYGFPESTLRDAINSCREAVDEGDGLGCTVRIDTDVLVYWPRAVKTMSDYIMLCHELDHAAFFILDMVGINPSVIEAQEAHTYLQEHLQFAVAEGLGMELKFKKRVHEGEQDDNTDQ